MAARKCRRTLNMKRKRHPPEEIIKKLREAATLLAGGQSVEEVCKHLEVSPPTYRRWRQEYGGAKEETVSSGGKTICVADPTLNALAALGIPHTSRAAVRSRRRKSPGFITGSR